MTRLLADLAAARPDDASSVGFAPAGSGSEAAAELVDLPSTSPGGAPAPLVLRGRML